MSHRRTKRVPPLGRPTKIFLVRCIVQRINRQLVAAYDRLSEREQNEYLALRHLLEPEQVAALLFLRARRVEG